MSVKFGLEEEHTSFNMKTFINNSDLDGMSLASFCQSRAEYPDVERGSQEPLVLVH